MVVGRYGAPRRQQQRTSTVDVVSCGIPGVRYVDKGQVQITTRTSGK